jgi:uncharacterized protein (DUF952 family)
VKRHNGRDGDDRNYCLSAQVPARPRRRGASVLFVNDLLRKLAATGSNPGLAFSASCSRFAAADRKAKDVTIIYKICERASWEAAEADRFFAGSAVDQRDGFIHFSTAAQLAGTAAKHFAGLTDLILVAVDADALGGKLKWETSRGGELFPHLYAALPLSAVQWARPLPDEIAGQRPLPELTS